MIGGNGVALLMPVWKGQQYLTLSIEVSQQEGLGSRAGKAIQSTEPIHKRALSRAGEGRAGQGRTALAHESGSLIGSL